MTNQIARIENFTLDGIRYEVGLQPAAQGTGPNGETGPLAWLDREEFGGTTVRISGGCWDGGAYRGDGDLSDEIFEQVDMCLIEMED